MRRVTCSRLGFLALVLTVALASCAGGGRYQNVSPDDLKVHLDDATAIVVDVRTPIEYAAGHVPGAINLPLDEIQDWWRSLPKDKTVYLICRTGHRSTQAAEYLKERGLRNLKNVTGGLQAWVARGYPLSTKEVPPSSRLGRKPAAPELTVPALVLPRLGGGQVALADLVGRPLVINLWASWCPPCRREMPLLARAALEHRQAVFLFVDQGEDAETVRRFLDEQGLVLEWVLLDQKSELGRAFRTSGIPFTFFFDAEGHLVARHPGELFPQALDRYLSQALGRRSEGPRSAAGW